MTFIPFVGTSSYIFSSFGVSELVAFSPFIDLPVKKSKIPGTVEVIVA